jgi:hypothetical protein
MTRIRFDAISTIVALALFAGPAASQEACSLPEAVPIPAPEAPLDVLLDELLKSCGEVASYQPWAGLLVRDLTGQVVAQTGELLVAGADGANPRLFVELISAGPTRALEVEPVELRTRWQDAALTLDRTDIIADVALHGGSISLPNGDELSVRLYSTLFDKEVKAIFASGANPYPEKLIVRFESSPTGAAVFVGQRGLGSTTTKAWVAREALVKIVLTLEGHAPCSFAEGSFSEPILNGDAVFSCSF